MRLDQRQGFLIVYFFFDLNFILPEHPQEQQYYQDLTSSIRNVRITQSDVMLVMLILIPQVLHPESSLQGALVHSLSIMQVYSDSLFDLPKSLRTSSQRTCHNPVIYTATEMAGR